jgi:iron complex outermembrane recepter protein
MAFFKPSRPALPLHPISRAMATMLVIASTSTLVCAQTSTPGTGSAGTLRPITVDERSAPAQAEISGFGDLPLKEIPISAIVIDRAQLKSSGARRLADLVQFDASLGDAYNSPGYWDYLSIRGFTLDNRFNYRREGLPISAETAIPLDNKERIEILKGTTGIQAGTSAPGGLVNYVVKRPTINDLREVRLEATSRSSLLAGLDFGGRFGTDSVFGYRLNVAHENLRPLVRNLDGQRSLASLATDWRISRDTLLEAEVEWSHKSQPSQSGFSLLGSTLPAPANPRLNLNNQPWSQPSVFDALTGSIRLEQALSSNWRWSAQIGSQRLKTDDRLAYAFGCGAEGNYDRYCSDGTFDYYDFRSENEVRQQHAANLNLKGKLLTGAVAHELGIGLQASRVRNRFQTQAYNYVGTGNVQGTAITPADPALTDPSTDRDERSIEFSVQDAIRWNERFTTWLGVRHTRLSRDSIRTDGSRPSSYDDGLTTPWVAASYLLAPDQMVYGSYGEGVESEIVRNKTSQYTNAGVALPALKSRQWEVGVKGGTDALGWQLAWFHIKRPMSNLDACNRLGTTPCLGQYDGEAVHKGVEANAQWRSGPWRLDGGITLLDAKRRGSAAEPATNGKRPVNVPDWTLRARAAWRVMGVPGLELEGIVAHEGKRSVLPDASIELPAWTRLDTALRYQTKMGATDTTWTLGIENLTDKRYWKEAPYQFGHVYLFPGAPRTLRLAFSAAL